MAKNPLITDKVREIIAGVYLKHTDWRAKEIRDEVEERLRQQNPRSKSGWPGLSAVQKELTKQRKTNDARPPELKKLDEPWHVLTLADYDMPAEALPALLLIWGKSQEEPDEPLTIREAKWVARLYHLVNNIDFLYVYAKHYASEERVAEITGKLPPSAAKAFFDDWWVHRPALEPLFLRLLLMGLPDLEVIAASIYERPPKDYEKAIERHRLMLAEVAMAAGLPKAILGELYESIKKGGTK